MHLIVHWVEVVVQTTLFHKCRFWTGEVPKLKLRVPLSYMRLEASCNVIIGTPNIVDMEYSVVGSLT